MFVYLSVEETFHFQLHSSRDILSFSLARKCLLLLKCRWDRNFKIEYEALAKDSFQKSKYSQMLDLIKDCQADIVFPNSSLPFFLEYSKLEGRATEEIVRRDCQPTLYVSFGFLGLTRLLYTVSSSISSRRKQKWKRKSTVGAESMKIGADYSLGTERILREKRGILDSRYRCCETFHSLSRPPSPEDSYFSLWK